MLRTPASPGPHAGRGRVLHPPAACPCIPVRRLGHGAGALPALGGHPRRQHRVLGAVFGENGWQGSRGGGGMCASRAVFVDLCAPLLDHPKLGQEINVTVIFERQIYIIYFLNTELKKL